MENKWDAEYQKQTLVALKETFLIGEKPMIYVYVKPNMHERERERDRDCGRKHRFQVIY